MLITVLLTVGSTIILALAAYAIYVVRIVYIQRKTNIKRKLDDANSKINAAKKARKDIAIILRVLTQGQMSLTEASIRVMTLQLALPIDEQHAENLSALNNLAQATSHIPILDQWSVLSREQQDKYDEERQRLETLYQKEIMDASHAYLKLNI